MNNETLTALTNEAQIILDERAVTWGTFADFMQDSSNIKDDFRMFYKNIDDMKKIEFYRLYRFIEEMLVLKLTRALKIVTRIQCLDYERADIKDCAIDFFNYCTLCKTQFDFELRFRTLQTDNDWLLFFDNVISLIVFDEIERDVDEN